MVLDDIGEVRDNIRDFKRLNYSVCDEYTHDNLMTLTMTKVYSLPAWQHIESIKYTCVKCMIRKW